MLSTTRDGFRRARRFARSCRWLHTAAVLIAVGVMGLFAGIGQAGQERYDYDPIGRLIRFTDSSNEVTEYTYDKAGNILSVVRGAPGSNLPPALSSVTPSVVRVGNTATLTLTGERLQVGTLQASDPGLDLVNVRQAATQVLADLTVSPSVPTGGHTLTFTNGQGSARVALTIAPKLPTISVEPSPLALPPDNTSRLVTLRLSNADLVPHQLSVGSSDTARMTVSPATVNFAVGQTTAQVSVTPKTSGFVNLTIGSSTLKPTAAPVFITSDFRGVNTSYAPHLGVRVGDAEVPTPPTAPATFVSGLGLVVGPVLTGVAPSAVPVGGTYTFTISGAGIPPGAQVSVVPSQNVSATVAAASSESVTVSLAVDAAAAAGPRRFMVRDSLGNVVPFASAAASQVRFTTGQPAIASIEPLFATRGIVTQIKVRGENLQAGQLVLAPGIDLAVDSNPVVNAAGTELTARVSIAALAATGTRVVRVVTPSGDSGAAATAANQFTIVSEIRNDVSPIFSAPLGVLVGEAQTQDPRPIGPVSGNMIGVTVGPVAFQTNPRVAVIGTSMTLVVQGTGLQAVTSATVSPAAGLTVGSFTVDPEGSSLSIPITIDAAAARGMRRVTLATAAGRLHFALADGDQVLVATPAPELVWVKPQVVEAGKRTTMSILGRNFHDVTDVILEPATGLTPIPPFVATDGGQRLTFDVQASADAPSGTRTVRVSTAGGVSTADPLPANTFQLARQVGPVRDGITSPPLGLVVGEAPQVMSSLDVTAPLLGVMVALPETPVTETRSVHATSVAVLVGPSSTGVSPRSPEGFLKGGAGTLTITGLGLGDIASVVPRGPAGVTLGQHQVNAEGTQMTVPVTVSPDASSTYYSVGLVAGGVRVTPMAEHEMFFRVGALPTVISSVAPIVLEQGKSYTFTVRGSNLRDVYQIVADPAGGLFFEAQPQWGSDEFGEKLTVPVRVEGSAAIGVRVVRFVVPGGVTSSDPTPANSITVVTPQ